jgi:hypothetical protein
MKNSARHIWRLFANAMILFPLFFSSCLVEMGEDDPFVIKTIGADSITNSSVVVGVFFYRSGILNTKQGLCWGEQPNPTLSNSQSCEEEGKNGYFSIKISDLSPDALYYVRAYIKTEDEIYYDDYDFIFRIVDTLRLSESFASSLGDFSAYSVFGTQIWSWNTYGYIGFAKMVGYSSGNIENEDWLISPSINLMSCSNAVLSFYHTHKYGVDVTNQLTLWAANQYQNGAAPSSCTWKQLDFTYASGVDYVFVESGEVSLNDFIGSSNTRIAFKYLSSSVESAPTWEIRNVSVVAK